MKIGYVLSVILISFALLGVAHAKSEEAEMDVEVSEDSDNMDNKASSQAGVVEADVEMTGYAIINGGVWIDGIKINKPQSVYVSRKSGKTYRIRWDKGGNVSVKEE